jgi:TRAP-type C4-dicarboxylate transport system permease small subunit
MITALSRVLSRASLAMAGFGLVAMTLIIGWQVFARYVLNAAPAWSEQAALFLLVHFVVFAAAAGVREGFHIRLTMVTDAMPRALAAPTAIVAHLVVGLFGIALAVWGGELVANTWSHTIPTLGLPRGLAYAPLPVAGGLIAFFTLEQILAVARGEEVEPLWS